MPFLLLKQIIMPIDKLWWWKHKNTVLYNEYMLRPLDAFSLHSHSNTTCDAFMNCFSDKIETIHKNLTPILGHVVHSSLFMMLLL